MVKASQDMTPFTTPVKAPHDKDLTRTKSSQMNGRSLRGGDTYLVSNNQAFEKSTYDHLTTFQSNEAEGRNDQNVPAKQFIMTDTNITYDDCSSGSCSMDESMDESSDKSTGVTDKNAMRTAFKTTTSSLILNCPQPQASISTSPPIQDTRATRSIQPNNGTLVTTNEKKDTVVRFSPDSRIDAELQIINAKLLSGVTELNRLEQDAIIVELQRRNTSIRSLMDLVKDRVTNRIPNLTVELSWRYWIWGDTKATRKLLLARIAPSSIVPEEDPIDVDEVDTLMECQFALEELEAEMGLRTSD